MIKNLNAYHILNTIIILTGVIVILKFMHVLPILGYGATWYYLIPIGLAFVIKSQLQPAHQSIKDPLFFHPWARRLIYSALGILTLAIMIRIMHWPYATYFFIISGLLQIGALIASFNYKALPFDENNEVLDQF